MDRIFRFKGRRIEVRRATYLARWGFTCSLLLELELMARSSMA